MVSHPYPLRRDQKCPGWPVWAVQLPSIEEETGDGQRAKSKEGSLHVLRSQKGEDQGPPQAGPLGARSRRGSEEPSTLSRHWPFYQAVMLLSVQVALAIRADRRPYSHKGRGDEMGAGRAGPSQWAPQTCHGVQNPVRVLSLLCWKKWKAPSLPIIPFFIWRSKGRLFLYSQHFWHQACKFFSWNNSSVLCGIQPGVPRLNSFWR